MRAAGRGAVWRVPMDGFLQPPSPASGAEEPCADGDLARSDDRRAAADGCGYGARRGGELGRRYRVDHISTATTAAKSSLFFMEIGTARLPT